MSQRESGYERKERDLYETPEWVTEVFCQHLWTTNFALGCCWEPAAGSGKMAAVLKRYADPGRLIVSDIEPLADGILKIDFLKSTRPPVYSDGFDRVGCIVTNPPYELATEFIEHSLRMIDGQACGLVAMLLRTDFDHAKSRAHLFRDCPWFKRKIVLTRRIKWFEQTDGSKGKSPSFNHAWYLWDVNYEGAPTIAYGP